MTLFSTTPNYSFGLIDFDASPWHDDEYNNWRMLDAILGVTAGVAQVRGIWDNSTLYEVGEKLVDVEVGFVYICDVQHTSAAADTFAADRTANPTFWSPIDDLIGAHSHVIADVTNLQTTLDGKALSVHTHVIADVTALQTTLDGKALTVHTHVIADTTGLQTALDGKAASTHTHVIGDVTALQTALDATVNQGIKHKWLSAGFDIRATVTSGAALADGEFGTINLTMPVLNFVDAATRAADAVVALPKSYDGGTIRAKLYWIAAAAGGGNDVVWDVGAAFIRNGDAAGAAVSTPVQVVAAAEATAEDMAIEDWTSAITPTGTISDDAMLWLRFRRLGSDGSDTFTNTASLVGAVIEYTVDAATDA